MTRDCTQTVALSTPGSRMHLATTLPSCSTVNILARISRPAKRSNQERENSARQLQTIRVPHPHLVKKHKHFLVRLRSVTCLHRQVPNNLPFFVHRSDSPSLKFWKTVFCTMFNRQQTNDGLFPILTCGPSRLLRLRQN